MSPRLVFDAPTTLASVMVNGEPAVAKECSFRLLCGYSSSHFGDERHARHLDRIFAQHNHTPARAQRICLLGGCSIIAARSFTFLHARLTFTIG